MDYFINGRLFNLTSENKFINTYKYYLIKIGIKTFKELFYISFYIIL